jgi:hypothetical protein
MDQTVLVRGYFGIIGKSGNGIRELHAHGQGKEREGGCHDHMEKCSADQKPFGKMPGVYKAQHSQDTDYFSTTGVLHVLYVICLCQWCDGQWVFQELANQPCVHFSNE